MKIIDTRDIPIDKIIKFSFQLRFDKEKLERWGIDEQKIKTHEKNKKETIQGIEKSLDRNGLLNSVIVRESDGKYQLIVGDLRLQACQANGKKDISAKIVEASDLEARIISLAENYHRRDLIDIEKEEAVYHLWIDGKELFNNNIKIMSDWTGIPYVTLKMLLQGAEERHKEEEKEEGEQSKEIINSTAKDLKITRQLEKIDSESRKELLKAKFKKSISRIELEPSVKAIKSASEKNAPKEVLSGIAKLISEKKLNPYNAVDFAKTIAEIPKEEQKQLMKIIEKEEKVDISEVKPVANAIKNASEKNASKEVLTGIVRLVSEKKLNPNNAEEFADIVMQVSKEEQVHLIENIKKEEKVDIYKVRNFVDTYNTSPPDIQKKLMEKKIEIDEAKIVSKFHTKEAREQIIEERKTISNLKEKELEKHTNVRAKQEEDVELSGDRKRLTKMDMEKIIKEFEDSDEQVDKRTIDSCREAASRIKKLFLSSTIKNMHTDTNRKDIIESIWQVYRHCHGLLLEIDEIKVISGANQNNSIIPKLYSGQ